MLFDREPVLCGTGETMRLKTIEFLSLLFVALAMAPAMAHLLELPNKISLSREEYLVVQQIYQGWALLGVVILGALVFTLVLTIMVRKERKSCALTLTALLCIVASLIIFFTFTFPTNQITENWTRLPETWRALRNQWEFSHATNAVLYLIAFSALSLSIVRRTRSRDE
jgi:FtsH-binding integral membrane protein